MVHWGELSKPLYFLGKTFGNFPKKVYPGSFRALSQKRVLNPGLLKGL